MIDSFALLNRGHSISAKVGAVLVTLLALVPISSSHLMAQADQRVLGPVDTSILGVHRFPLGIIDETGTSLAPCIDPSGAVPVCLAGSAVPNRGPASVPDNIPEEFFYFVADSDIGNVTDPNGGTASKDATFRFGVEASVDPVTGEQNFFGRVRTRIRGGLVAGQSYRITHPYGVLEGRAVAVADRADFNVTEDLGCPPLAPQPCDFATILATRTFPFLVWDGTGIPTPAGFIGDVAIPHTVTGSPFGTNFVTVERISGPGAGGGTVIANSARFFVAGKLIDFMPPTAAITAPLAGDVLGSVTVNATGADEPKGSGLASLKIMLDDVTTLATSATSPASAVWNTTTVKNGPHTLTAIATDVGGNVGTSAVVTVNVNNAVFVTVPDVVGLGQATAERNITRAGLVSAINTATSATVAAGLVISQTPVGGTSAATGSTVTLVVSSGPAPAVQVAVPDVVGLAQTPAKNRMTNAGLLFTVTTANDPIVKAGKVIRTMPLPGTLVPSGSTVELVVSSGPAPAGQVAVPDVVGLAQTAAQNKMTNAGLLFTVTPATDPIVKAGKVISQSLDAGTLVPAGITVALVVSSGP